MKNVEIFNARQSGKTASIIKALENIPERGIIIQTSAKGINAFNEVVKDYVIHPHNNTELLKRTEELNYNNLEELRGVPNFKTRNKRKCKLAKTSRKKNR